MKRDIGLLVLILGCLFAFACSLVPTEKTQKVESSNQSSLGAKTSTDIVHEAVGQPVESHYDFSFNNIKGPVAFAMTQPAPIDAGYVKTSAKTNVSDTAVASSRDEASGSVTIPLFVKIIGVAVGGLLFIAFLVVAGFFIRRAWMAAKTTAAGAALSGFLQEADGKLAAKISALTTVLHTENDPVKKAQIVSQIAELQEARPGIADTKATP